jgi:cyclophilin family peptidyl-prolyl cis-trans isomerase
MAKPIHGILLTIALSALVLSACTPPEEDGSVDLFYGSNNQQTNPPTANQETTPKVPQKGAMKSLTDFETIPATQATITTSKGDITIELYRDQAPITTANFLNLAKSGFYNGIVFHRVIADFMAQVGDPLTKDPSKQAMWGTGGPGYTIPDEFGQGLTHDSAGIVSMANSGPNTGGSQFFITFAPTTWLDGKHAIFGKVTQGMDVLAKIQQGDTITTITYK